MTDISARPLATSAGPLTPSPPGARAVLASGGVLALSVLLALTLVVAFEATTVSVPLALAGGLALVGFVALVLARFDLAVAIAVALGAVVFVEPAPTDAAFVLILAVVAVTGRLRLDRAPGSIRLFVAALLALNLASMVDAIDTPLGLRFSLITAYLAVVGLWLSTWVDSEKRARLIVVSWLAVGVLTAVASVVAFNVPLPGRALLLDYGDTRARGLFKDPNVFGPFLVPIAVILLEQRVRPRLLHLRGWTSAALMVALTLGIIFSFSRAAWLNYALAIGVMLLAAAAGRRGGGRALRTALSLLVVGVVVVGILGASGSLDFLGERAQLQSYDSQRFGAQREGYELGWEHPVGVGPGQFEFYSDVETHSAYVRVFAEQGFGGLMAWIALTLATLLLAVRNTIRGVDTYGIGAPALLGAWCGLVLNSAVIDTLHWRHLWLVAALIWAGALRERRDAQASAASGRSPALAGALGGTPK